MRSIARSSTRRRASTARILFLSANPKGTKRLRVDEELRAIAERINAAECRDGFAIEQEWAVRIRDLQWCLLRYKPDVVHFSGHGSNAGEIILENETGRPQPVPIPALKELFAILRQHNPIRCVVLNCCCSKSQAAAIAESVECVICMSEAIGDAAIPFAAAFYQALAFGQDVRTAFRLGRNQIHLEGLPHHATPDLIVRPGIKAADVYLAQIPRLEQFRIPETVTQKVA